MRLLIQRVKEAKVIADGEESGKISHGLLVFLAVHKGDGEKPITWLVEKLVNLRIFSDEEGKMNRSVQDVGGGILLVSQFTLYAGCEKGRRPDFVNTMSGPEAERLYNRFQEELKKRYENVATGRFGAFMEVSLTNDGPVTLLLEK